MLEYIYITHKFTQCRRYKLPRFEMSLLISRLGCCKLKRRESKALEFNYRKILGKQLLVCISKELAVKNSIRL